MSQAARANSTTAPAFGRLSTTVDADHHRSSPVDASIAQPSRRSLLGAIASLTATAAGMPALAAAAADADRELIALGLEYDRADAALDAAYADHDRRCEAYEAIEPKPGDGMRHRVDDLSLNLPVGPETTEIGVRPGTGDPYTADEIGMLVNIPPPWRIDDVVEQRARIAEITGEFERWTAACAAARAATGLDGAEAAVDAAVRALFEIARRIADLPAKTVAGLQVRAGIISRLYDGDLSGEIDGDGINCVMLWSIARDLAAMQRRLT